MDQLSFYERPVDTLTAAKREVETRLASGITCPCCGQYARQYRFGLSEKNVYMLACLYRMTGGDGYAHIDRLADYARARIKGGTSFSIMAWWGLIAEKPNEDEKKKTSGFWRITDVGLSWLKGDIRVPKYVYSYNDEIKIVPSEALITVHEVPWKHFDYHELMNPGL